MGNLELLKGTAAVSLLIIAILGGFLPLHLHHARVNQETLRRCNGMAGGVLLAAALVHLLPDAQEALHAASVRLKELFTTTEEPFPTASMLSGIMFLVLMMIEAQVQNMSASSLEEADHGHYCGADHGHFCGADAMKDALSNLKATRPLLKSDLEAEQTVGISIGVLNRTTTFVSIFLAVGAHKGLAGFAMGTKLMQSTERREFWISILMFGLCTPLGILLGSSVLGSVTGTGVGCCLALAAGTFLYIAIPELLLPAVQSSRDWRSG
ncbi:unnamed protein product [Cladocopium goreaui]|uniref:Zinc transporter ZIP1 (DrZIP1) (Solute carrier family 39 member 1) (Zrt- and Irt-like protein 1) (ZIP-1) n=1 Tax=Cladocopium goreaui TaxID=2562237 RepID=A0A9P1FGA3_9DINO|nr:unnamed protein product [Cladocopium goreaui]